MTSFSDKPKQSHGFASSRLLRRSPRKTSAIYFQQPLLSIKKLFFSQPWPTQEQEQNVMTSVHFLLGCIAEKNSHPLPSRLFTSRNPACGLSMSGCPAGFFLPAKLGVIPAKLGASQV
jgi:hypothetical protein